MDARQLTMLSIVAVVVVGVLAVRYSRRLALRRMAAAIVGVITALAWYLAMVGYAIPALSNVRSPRLKLGTTILGNVLLWVLCLVSLVLAARLLLYAIRPPIDRSKGSAKS